jgi:hypothetical protein
MAGQRIAAPGEGIEEMMFNLWRHCVNCGAFTIGQCPKCELSEETAKSFKGICAIMGVPPALVGTTEKTTMMKMSIEDAVKALNEFGDSMGRVKDYMLQYMECCATAVCILNIDRAYFAAGGLSDLALMRGQPF